MAGLRRSMEDTAARRQDTLANEVRGGRGRSGREEEKFVDRSCNRKAKSLGTLGTFVSSWLSSTYHAFLPWTLLPACPASPLSLFHLFSPRGIFFEVIPGFDRVTTLVNSFFPRAATQQEIYFLRRWNMTVTELERDRKPFQIAYSFARDSFVNPRTIDTCRDFPSTIVSTITLPEKNQRMNIHKRNHDRLHERIISVATEWYTVNARMYVRMLNLSCDTSSFKRANYHLVHLVAAAVITNALAGENRGSPSRHTSFRPRQQRNTRKQTIPGYGKKLASIFIASLIRKGRVTFVSGSWPAEGLKRSRIRILVTSLRFAFLRETKASIAPSLFLSLFLSLSLSLSLLPSPLSLSLSHARSLFLRLWISFFSFLLSFRTFSSSFFSAGASRGTVEKRASIRWWILGSLTFLLRPDRSFLRSWCGKSSPYVATTRRSLPQGTKRWNVRAGFYYNAIRRGEPRSADLVKFAFHNVSLAPHKYSRVNIANGTMDSAWINKSPTGASILLHYRHVGSRGRYIRETRDSRDWFFQSSMHLRLQGSPIDFAEYYAKLLSVKSSIVSILSSTEINRPA